MTECGGSLTGMILLGDTVILNSGNKKRRPWENVRSRRNWHLSPFLNDFWECHGSKIPYLSRNAPRIARGPLGSAAAGQVNLGSRSTSILRGHRKKTFSLLESHLLRLQCPHNKECTVQGQEEPNADPESTRAQGAHGTESAT